VGAGKEIFLQNWHGELKLHRGKQPHLILLVGKDIGTKMEPRTETSQTAISTTTQRLIEKKDLGEGEGNYGGSNAGKGGS